MKRFLYLILLASISFGYSQNIELDELYKSENICKNTPNDYYIEGKTNIKSNETTVHNINTLSGSKELKIKNVVYELYKDDVLAETLTGGKYLHNFVNPGKFYLKVNFEDENDCNFELEKDIHVYKGFVYYLGDAVNELDLGLENNFEKSGLLFNKLILSNNSIFIENEFAGKMQQDTETLKSSNIIIINNKNFSSIFQALGSLAKNEEYNFSDKKIFVISELNENFMKRLLARNYKNLGNSKIYIVNNTFLLNFLTSISLGKEADELSYLQKFSISYHESPKYLPLSYLIDLLIYNGFPSVLISFILTLCIGALVISIFRQIIGFSIFGIYSPLLFAVSISVIGIKFSFLLLFVAFLSTIITRIFTSKVYLLSSAKISLNIILYFIISIVVLSINSIFNLNIIDLSIFNDAYIIFPIIFLIITAEKVFHEGFNIFSKGWWFSFIEFLFVSGVVYYIISRVSLKYVLISYPEIIFLIIIINIYVGRFTGLQLLEYFRFMPLIKRHFDEE
ncbi:MAG: 7TM domain-containing protein [Candidatus Absconditabacteria bacterium]